VNLAHVFDRGASRMPRAEADISEDRCAAPGPRARSAYRPSGAPGRAVTLFLTGALAHLAALAVAAPFVIAAVTLDAWRGRGPGTIFVEPAVLLLTIVIPIAIGLTVGVLVASGVRPVMCRQPQWAGFCAAHWTIVTIAVLPLLGMLLTRTESFVTAEPLLSMVRRPVIGSADRIEIGAAGTTLIHDWIAYSVAGLGAMTGVAIAYVVAATRVRTLPYCERCRTYMELQTLWQIPMGRAAEALTAIETRDYDAIVRIPYCNGFRNHLNVQVLACPCGAAPIVELMATTEHPEKWWNAARPRNRTIRTFSMAMTHGQAEQIRRCGWGYRPLSEPLRPAKVA